MTKMIDFVTPVCPVCNRAGFIELSAEAVERWYAGELIQVCFPDISIDLREQMMTGIHPACWLVAVGPEDDE
jgi:hypothetical protein